MIEDDPNGRQYKSNFYILQIIATHIQSRNADLNEYFHKFSSFVSACVTERKELAENYDNRFESYLAEVEYYSTLIEPTSVELDHDDNQKNKNLNILISESMDEGYSRSRPKAWSVNTYEEVTLSDGSKELRKVTLEINNDKQLETYLRSFDFLRDPLDEDIRNDWLGTISLLLKVGSIRLAELKLREPTLAEEWQMENVN